jgi:hypothetical protein
MKMFNIVIGYDLWVVAGSKEEAITSAKEIIALGQESPGEIYGYDIANVKHIPARVDGVLPFVTEAAAAYLTKLGADLDKADIKATYQWLNDEKSDKT